MKATGGATPAPSPSPFSDEGQGTQELEDTISPSQLRSSSRETEKHYLPRDNYKCIITGYWSHKAPKNHLPSNAGTIINTQIAHIIPYSLAQHGQSVQDVCLLKGGREEKRRESCSVRPITDSSSKVLGTECFCHLDRTLSGVSWPTK